MAFYPEVFCIYAVNSLQFASPLGDNTRNNLYEKISFFVYGIVSHECDG